jgi:hypothetical protein
MRKTFEDGPCRPRGVRVFQERPRPPKGACAERKQGVPQRYRFRSFFLGGLVCEYTPYCRRIPLAIARGHYAARIQPLRYPIEG